ncbi:MAG TPA: hypothetical protein VGC74_02780 [Stenotrophomonas sp.]|jgi:hypothetical protein
MNLPKSLLVLGVVGVVAGAGLLHSSPAEAIQRAARTGINHAPGGGGRAAHVDRGANYSRPANGNVNRNANIDHNVNRNVNNRRDIDIHNDIDVDVDNHWHNGWYDHPVAAAAAVTTAAVVTAAVVGSIVYSVPPSCVTTVINGIAYQQCGSTWYRPQYAGTSVQYVVIEAPR